MFIPIHDGNPLRFVRFPIVTVTIIIVTSLIFVLFQSGIVINGMNASVLAFGVVPAVVNDIATLPDGLGFVPESATLFTYAFLHGDWMHLIGNMLFVWVFGDNVEDALGHLKFLVFYLLCAAGAAVTHILVMPASQAPLVGASGAAAGIIAAYLMLHPNVKVWILAMGRIPLRISAAWVLGAWIVFQVFNILIAGPDEEVAWWAHIGGLATGAALILVMRRRGVPLFDRQS
ncbi:MAG: rhomboid family intramembrane serine protease [Hyphomicrobiales bacterium]